MMEEEGFGGCFKEMLAVVESRVRGGKESEKE